MVYLQGRKTFRLYCWNLRIRDRRNNSFFDPYGSFVQCQRLLLNLPPYKRLILDLVQARSQNLKPSLPVLVHFRMLFSQLLKFCLHVAIGFGGFALFAFCVLLWRFRYGFSSHRSDGFFARWRWRRSFFRFFELEKG